MIALTRRRFSSGLAAAALICAPAVHAQTATPLRVALDSPIDGSAAPLLLAIDRSYMAAENLDLAIDAGLGARAAVTTIAEGAHDIGFGDFNALVRLRDNDPRLELKAVAILHEQPAFAVIGRKSRGISEDPNSLVGAHIGATAGEATLAQWPLFRKLIGLADKSVQIETVGVTVREPMLVQGEVDAVLGFSMSSIVNLRARDVPQEDVVSLLMSAHGLELYGNAILAGGKLLRDDQPAVRAFLRAFTRGLREAIADPAAAVEAVLRRNPAAVRELEIERLRLMLSQNVLTAYVRQNGFGGLDAARFQRSIDQHAGVSDFRRRPQLDDVFAAGFLPTDAERRIG